MGQRIKTVEKEIMREVADELDLPFYVVEDMVVNGQSAFIAYIMKTSTFASIKCPFLGKFEVNFWKMVVRNYRKGMDKFQQKLFWKRVKEGNILPMVPKWAIERDRLSDKQKELLKQYGDAVVES